MADMMSPFKFFWNYRNPYHTVRDTGKREGSRRQIQSEDWMVRDYDRQVMSATGKDMYRNLSVASWAIRKHLDYCTVFDFQAKTPNERFNREAEQFISWWSERVNCDAQRKHPLRRLIRIAEQLAVTDGDVFLMKIGGMGPQRGSIQILESDRIKNPGGDTTGPLPSQASAGDSAVAQAMRMGNWVRGILVSQRGIASRYAVHRRTDNADLEFERTVPAPNIIHHGFYFRNDMLRGISPINAAANSFRDLYEATDYAVAGVKAAQLVGLFIKREFQGNDMRTENSEDTDGDGLNDARPKMKLGPRPFTMYGRPGDEAQFLDARKPAIETTMFLEALTHMSIKCLDIPKSFWDASSANYSSMRMDKIEFNRSIEPKRNDVQDVLHQITKWRIGMAIADGELRQPRGIEFDELCKMLVWVPRGTPWVDPDKETKGAIAAVDNNFDNPYRVASQNGTDAEDNVRLKLKLELFEKEERERMGLTAPQPMVAETEEEPETEEPEEEGDDEQ